MAYGARYIFNFRSDNGKDVVIRISENGYSGSTLSRHVGGSPQLRLEQSDCIKGMSLEIPAECIIEDEYADLYTSDPYKYLVEVEIDSTPMWKGYITPELYSAPWIDPPYDVTLTATDGLGELKMHTYPALGRQSLEALLSTLLGATGLNLPIKFVNTAETDVNNASGLLGNTTVNLDTHAGDTYYDVLQAILTSLHATIQQRNGAWLIVRETDINSMTVSDNVTDTAGATYPITDFGSMNDYDVWPVGRLRMEIVPAKNSIKVSAANDFIESLMADPNMREGGWSGDGTHYTTDGGFYALEQGQMIYQDFIPDTSTPEDYPDYFDWKFKYRQSGYNEAVLQIAVEATGIERDVNQPIVVSWVATPGGGDGRWYEGTRYNRIEVEGAHYGNSADCKDLTVSIRMFAAYGLTSWLSRIDRIRFYFVSQSNTIYIHQSTVSISSFIEGVNTALILNNNARGAAPDVEPAFADTYIGNNGLPFMWNSVYGGSTRVSSWKSAIMPALPYGEFLAKDYALSVANPRLRLQGKLNVPSGIPSLFYRTQQIAYLAESWDFDLLRDEADISLISMPASAIQVTSVRQMAFNEDGETDLSVSVFPSSFTIPSDDSTTRYYMAINAPSDYSWTVTGIPAWMTMSSSDQSGTGSDTISFVCSANSGSARTAVLIVAGIPVSVNQEGIGTDYPLIIETTPADASISYTINGGTSIPWVLGAVAPSGSTVVVTVAKTGYTTVVDTFTMPAAATTKTYTLTQSIEATVSPVGASISQSAQSVSYTVSDAGNHGWTLDFDGPEGYGKITAAGITSGSAIVDNTVIRGTGDAVVYLTVTANSNVNTRTIEDYPFRFKDQTTNTVTSLWINQLGTGDSSVAVTGITLDKQSITISAGSSEKITATVAPSNATNKNLTWHSSNNSVASVGQDGTVYGVSTGSATISATATDGSGKAAYCTVTVTGSTVPVQGVTLNKASMVIKRGTTGTLTATVTPANATDKTVSWSSSDTSIATVSSGVVTGVAVGTATITVTTTDGGKTATCTVNVTANGSMSADPVTVNSVTTSASTTFTALNMVLNTITASENVSWLSSPTVDTSGNPYRVRLTVSPNTGTTSRSATVTLSGTDEAGSTVTTTFRITQNGRTSSDVPCTSMEIGGAVTISNSGNSSEYTASFKPNATTQAQVGEWSVVSGGSYVTITPDGLSCTVAVKPGAVNQTVVLKATNYYNASVYATKTITVSYIAPITEITVNPASVTVHAVDTGDNTPTVTATDIESGSLGVQSVSGFITSASISGGKLVTVFPANTNSSSRDGSVTLTAIPSGGGTSVTSVVTYTQMGTGTGTKNLAIMALNVAQVGGKVNLRFSVNYLNQSINETTFTSQSWSLKGYDDNETEVFTKTGSLSNKTCAGMTTETEIYTEQWNGTTGMSTSYVLTLTSSGMTVTYTGDGNDEIE